jgi:asparagine synthase (glutamine-hydrolysing)
MEGILPNDVIYRPKMGFGVPLRAWLRGPLKNMLHDLLSTDTLLKRGLFDPKAMSQLVSENERGRADHAYSILSLMCIELWCQGFLDGDASWPQSQSSDAGVRVSNVQCPISAFAE